MAKTQKTPTKAQFEAFEAAYEYFNQVLFSYELPPVILNLSRKSKAMGFVAPFRWQAAGQEATEGEKGTLHELSINPEILYMSPIDVYSTLVHEQCHIWQFHCGKPSRRTYHNKEWASKMLEVGLTPSSTGETGGNMTGQKMSDYPTPDGAFLKALDNLPHAFKLPFISTEGLAKAETDGGSSDPKPKNKVKYSCPSCNTNAWGKQDINLICGDCEVRFDCL